MKIMIDTDKIVLHLRGKERLNLETKKHSYFISVITYGELIFGCWKSKRYKENKKIIDELTQTFEIQIVEVDKAVTSIYAEIKYGLEMIGSKLDEFDLLIASCAISRKCKLMTNNKKHFQRIGNLELHD